MNFAHMSDDELMSAPPPVVSNEPVVEENTDTVNQPDIDQDLTNEGEDELGGGEADDSEVQQPSVEDLSDEELANQQPPATTTQDPPAEEPKKDEKEKAPEPVVQEPAVDTPPAIDPAVEYGRLIGSPIKANGKELVLKNTDEAIRLIQQGANYAKRMEELKPARRTATILEQAGLLGNEEALLQMIDLYNGKPEAITKMAKDLKIDLYALDMETSDTYRPTGNRVTDEQVTFNETLKEVRTLPGGLEAMQLIDTWDQASKDLIWGNAQAVREIYDYKQNGVYDIVATEVERRRTLGQIPEGMPFIQAFAVVGEELGKSAPAGNTATAPEPIPSTPTPEPAKPVVRTPVATGPAPRKPAATPDNRAAAAAAPRGGGGVAAKPAIDIYSLSDADIERMQSPQG